MDDVRDIEWRQYGQTVIDPVALLFLAAMAVWLLMARRNRAVIPIVLVACLIPVTQRIVIATLDFNLIRIMIMVGWFRIFARGEARPLRLNGLDLAFVAWIAAGGLIHVLREGDLGAVVYKAGISFDGLGIYFLFRTMLRDRADLIRTLFGLGWVTIAVAGFMGFEWLTGYNVFAALFGSGPVITSMREGLMRCRGAFSHPIMAGSFGATLVPLFFGMTRLHLPRRQHRLAVAATVGAAIITYTSGSSGAFMAFGAAAAAWAVWPWRRNLRAIRWGIVAAVIFVHLIREKPVWHLIGRVSNIVGGTGWHRYRLIDAFIDNFGEWWLLGTNDVAYWGWGLQDTTNWYVANGVNGGLLTLVTFVVMLGFAYTAIGVAMKPMLRRPRARNTDPLLLFWGFGVMLTAHCVSFLSVSYFGQMMYVFYLELVLISLLRVAWRPRPAVAPAPAPAPAAPAARSAASGALGPGLVGGSRNTARVSDLIR